MGAAIYSSGASFQITNSEFRLNNLGTPLSTESKGGTIYCEFSECNITSSIFNNNFFTHGERVYGGVIHFERCTNSKISNNNFSNTQVVTSGFDGSVIAVVHSTNTYLVNNNFHNNTATAKKWSSTGTISFRNSYDVILQGNIFDQNTCVSDETFPSILGCIISIVYCENTSIVNLSIFNSRVITNGINNDAHSGIGVRVLQSKVNIENSSIKDNLAISTYVQIFI